MGGGRSLADHGAVPASAGGMTHRGGRRRALLGLVVSTWLLALGWGSASAAEAQGCITRLAVSVSLPSPFAAAYPSSVGVGLSTTGRTIRDVRASLYTFAGDQIATGRLPVLSGSRTLKMKLAFAPLQQGSYTLVVTGEPNANPSCGPKKLVEVVTFRGCITGLPLKFVSPPGGTASDYGGYLSLTVQSAGPLIRHLEGAVYDADGTVFGQGTLNALYGQASLDLRLDRPLVAGDYSVVVAGLIQQPPSCGPKTIQIDLHFN
jgi:hypothetical protein